MLFLASYLAAPVSSEGILLGPLIGKTSDMMPLVVRKLIPEAGEGLVQAKDVVVSAGLAGSCYIDAHNTHGLGGENDVVTLVTDVVVEVGHVNRLLTRIGHKRLSSFRPFDLYGTPIYLETLLDTLALHQATYLSE